MVNLEQSYLEEAAVAIYETYADWQRETQVLSPQPIGWLNLTEKQKDIYYRIAKAVFQAGYKMGKAARLGPALDSLQEDKAFLMQMLQSQAAIIQEFRDILSGFDYSPALQERAKQVMLLTQPLLEPKKGK